MKVSQRIYRTADGQLVYEGDPQGVALFLGINREIRDEDLALLPDGGAALLPDVSDEERVAPGTGVEMIPIDVPLGEEGVLDDEDAVPGPASSEEE